VALKICQRGLEPEAAFLAAVKGDFKPLPLGGVALKEECRARPVKPRGYHYSYVFCFFCCVFCIVSLLLTADASVIYRCINKNMIWNYTKVEFNPEKTET